jgi:putative ABC transport system permease protein
MKPGFYWIQKALLSHYWRHPWQALFQIVGLVAGVGLWSAVQIINQHAEDSYREAQNLLGAQAGYWIQSRRDEGIETAQYAALRRAGFRQVFPLVELEVSTPDGISISIIATDLLALPDGTDGGGAGLAAGWLDFIQPPYQAWVPRVLADELDLEAGERLALRDGRRLPPALIRAREQQGRRVFMDIGAAMALSGDRRIDYLAVGAITPAEYRRLAAMLPAELELVENHQHIDLRELTESLHTHLDCSSSSTPCASRSGTAAPRCSTCGSWDARCTSCLRRSCSKPWSGACSARAWVSDSESCWRTRCCRASVRACKVSTTPPWEPNSASMRRAC